MVKDDERRLLAEFQRLTKVWVGAGSPCTTEMPYMRKLVADLGLNEKRADFILEKWTRRGWYEYGVSPFAGWLSDEGLAVVL